MTENLKILIDADSIYFRSACSQEKKTYNMYSKKRELVKSIDFTMKEIEGECFMGDSYVAVKGRGNFRKDIYPQYKATRPELTEQRKELLNHGYNYMVDKYGAVPAHNMEADDLVSIWAHECIDSDEPYVVAGIDKDLLQIPGNHYNYNKKTHQCVDPDTANYNLMLQCITGDNSDNIPGIQGVGPVKAKKILAGIPSPRMWNRVQAAWRMHKSGSPVLSRDLLTMLSTFQELEVLKEKYNANSE